MSSKPLKSNRLAVGLVIGQVGLAIFGSSCESQPRSTISDSNNATDMSHETQSGSSAISESETTPAADLTEVIELVHPSTQTQGQELDPDSIDSEDFFKDEQAEFYLKVGRSHALGAQLEHGKMLVIGGYDKTWMPLSSAEIFDPETGQTTLVGSLKVLTHPEGAVSLQGGKVLVLGGKDERGWASPQLETFDPLTEEFELSGKMAEVRGRGMTGTLLIDGQVLVAGGDGPGCTWSSRVLASAELYDPVTQVATRIRRMNDFRSHHAAVRLLDGRVLITGGAKCYFNGVFGWLKMAQKTAEIYDPQTKSFTPVGDMMSPRERHFSLLLGDGRVAIVGGTNFNNFTQDIEIYDPGTETFSRVRVAQNYSVYNALALSHGESELSHIVLLGDLGVEIIDLSTDEASTIKALKQTYYYSALSQATGGEVQVIGAGVSDFQTIERVVTAVLKTE